MKDNTNSKHLNDKDVQEYNFLRRRSNRTSPPNKRTLQKLVLDAIKIGEAKVTGVDTSKKVAAGELGFLERSRGGRNGDLFYFNRAMKVGGTVYIIESLFNLPNSTQRYAHLERK